MMKRYIRTLIFTYKATGNKCYLDQAKVLVKKLQIERFKSCFTSTIVLELNKR